MGRRRCSRSTRKEKNGKKRTALSTTVFYSCVCKMIMFKRAYAKEKSLLFFVRRAYKKMLPKGDIYRLLRAVELPLCGHAPLSFQHRRRASLKNQRARSPRVVYNFESLFH